MTRRARAGVLPIATAFVTACGGGGSSGGPSGPPAALGTLEVAVEAIGEDGDLDGYVVTVVSGTSRREQRLPASEPAPLSFQAAAGTHRVEIEDLAGNCDVVDGPPSRDVSVEAGVTTRLTFEIACADIPPLRNQIVRAVAAWTGATEIGLFATEPDGGNERRLTFPSGAAWDNHPHVSPDGKRIVFVRHDQNADPGSSIRIANADGTEEPGYLSRGENPRWSPDGERIVFFTGDGGLPDIQTIRPDGTGLQNLTRAPEAPDINPDWSPDGSRIAFRSIRREGTLGDLFTIDPSGGGAMQLTQSEGGGEGEAPGDFNPRYSPDGTRIAFTSNRSGDWRVYIMNQDGSGIVQVTPDSDTYDDFMQAWSADGGHLLFKREHKSDAGSRTAANDPDLYTIELSSGIVTRITDNAVDDHAADWSR